MISASAAASRPTKCGRCHPEDGLDQDESSSQQDNFYVCWHSCSTPATPSIGDVQTLVERCWNIEFLALGDRAPSVDAASQLNFKSLFKEALDDTVELR